MVFYYVSFAIGFINILAILWMIFKEQKKTEVIISWLLLFSVLPLIGLLIYVIVGGGVSVKTERMLRRKQYYNDHYKSFYRDIAVQKATITNREISEMIRFNVVNAQSVPTFHNNIKFFIDGAEIINSLIEDLKKAQHSINMEYYIFADDKVGNQVMQVLCQKAKEGVKVKLIFDSVGSLKSRRKYFRQLRKAGGEVCEFFPPLFYIRLINLRVNSRNHRKIVVIDGKIGYVGGVNIRDDHCGCGKKLNPWCDAHIRVTGETVYALQNTFFNFWQFCKKDNKETERFVEEGYFPKFKPQGDSIMQVITSGPDNTKHLIKENMVRLMMSANKEVIIQTPYFIPDDAYMSALKTVARSGAKVKLILPGVPDKKMVYYATMSFAKQVLDFGGEVYIYQGFMHAKTVVIDDIAMTIGTANSDSRSFSLNFEVNANIYDKKEVQNYKKLLDEVISNSKLLTLEEYNKRPRWTRAKQLFFRLFSPLF